MSLMPGGDTTRRKKRSRTGCLTCRARKIKCDEAAVRCSNCLRAALECVRSANNESFPQSARVELASSAVSNETLTQAGLRRRRVKRSCVPCQLGKRRCGGERPRCGRCLNRSLGCVYEQVLGTWPSELPEANDVTERVGLADVPEWSPSHTAPVHTASPTDNLPSLTDMSLVRELCDVYFEEIAPLRCLGFLHRHTYLQEIGNHHPPENDALLLCVCALATKTTQKYELWDLGCEWARKAQRLVFAEIHDISVKRLMCIVLLHENAARVGEQRLCFMLSAMASRFAQALSLNLEYDDDTLCMLTTNGGGSSSAGVLSPMEKESRRRLFWACYIIDTIQAGGLNHLQLIDTSTIKIQLPCDDRHFLYKIACRTAVITSNTRFSETENSAMNRGNNGNNRNISGENQDMDAYLIRLYLIRERLLQYIDIDSRNDDKAEEAEDPWRLTRPLADLESWNESLPPELQFNSDVIAIRKEQSMLSALISLHVLYHQVNCLLYRCTIPSMLFPARAQTRLSRRASADFLSESRKGWFDHACAMSSIFEVALEYKPVSMTDPAVAISAYNAIIIKWLYLTNFVPSEERLPRMMGQILPMVKTDLSFLRELYGYHPSVGVIYSAASRLVDEAQVRVSGDPTVILSETSNLVENLGAPGADRLPPDHRTNPLSTFAQMRKKLADAHPADRGPGFSSTSTSPCNEDRIWDANEGLWVWR